MICSTNQWTGLYMIGNFVMKELNVGKECVHLTNRYQYIFSVCLKFGAYYITAQWDEFIKKMLLNTVIHFLGFFLLFFIMKFVFYHFISFFDEVSNFCNRILTNQKHELVVSNCQRNCM